jgi:hypothetical protein
MDPNEKWDLEGNRKSINNIDYSYYKSQMMKNNNKNPLPFLHNNWMMGLIAFTSVLYLVIAYVIIVYK